MMNTRLLLLFLLFYTVEIKSKSEEKQMSVWARKAGGSWKPTVVENILETSTPNPAEVADTEYTYGDEESSSEEGTCPHDMFYHIRGGHCVPFTCPGGNKMREPQTGDCMLLENPHRFRGSSGLHFYWVSRTRIAGIPIRGIRKRMQTKRYFRRG